MLIVVTMGDPSGIGPEIILKAYFDSMLHGKIVVGSKSVLEKYRMLYKLPVINYNILQDKSTAADVKEGALDRKSTRLNSSHTDISRMPSSA